MSDVSEVLVPQMNPNDDRAVLVRWHVSSGSWVQADQALATLETSKVTFDVNAPREGYVFFEQQPKTSVTVGTAFAWLSPDNRPPPSAISSRGEEPQGALQEDAARFTRKALKLMKELGLREADFGPSGRVDVAAVERMARNRRGTHIDAASQTVEPLEQSSTKIIEAQMLAQVYRQAVPSTVAVGLSCEKTRRRLQESAARSGPLSLLELAIFETARLLKEFPDLNGYYAEERSWHHRNVHIGFAINMGKGLQVPVVKNAAECSLADVCRHVRELSLRYMRNELTVEHLTGGSFTVTDLSSFGVHYFAPVLNERQSAILGICAERPGAAYQELVLTFDHRMSDGMRAAMFLTKLVKRLENATP